jgi:hydrogenase nickel incorporation protein HypA/HybF
MHELSIMSYLLEAVEARARELGAHKVLAINLVLGERAGIDDSLLFYFDALTPGTPVEGASLNIRRTPMRFHCAACDSDYKPSGADFACPRCGAVGQLVDGATELLIESIEIET